MGRMARATRHPLITGAWITSLGTLASRVLGMVRDIVTANLLGMSGGVMDAFVVAFRIPNSFRRFFGEGALAVSYLPVITARAEKDRAGAWRLASVTMTLLALLLAVLVALAEMVFAVIWLVWADVPGVRALVGLCAVLMPYLWFVCLAAQVAATLHALSHFTAPALAPALLNVCWLGAAWLVAPRFSDPLDQAYVLAGAILVSGALQMALQWPVLWRLGFRFTYDWQAARSGIVEIVRTMLPMMLGLAVTQINALADSLIAWALSSGPTGPERIGWLGGWVGYPMRQGAAASIYYSERLYQFPLGIVGLAVATAIFPLLSRHAAKSDYDQLGADLTLGLRLVVLLGIPAGAGLILLAEPLTRLLFEHGQFTAADTARTARMLACYSSGVWAYCALPVVVRGYYAMGDRRTPVAIGTRIVGFNLLLNLLLVWPLAEAGLAVATAVAASVQVLLLVGRFSRHVGSLGWRALAVTTLRTLAASTAMVALGGTVLAGFPFGARLPDQVTRVGASFLAGLGAFFAVYSVIGYRELRGLLGGRGLWG